MWIFIWVILSSILIGASLWSLQILLKQKSAWEKFSKAHNFSFNRGTFMGPAEMNGIMGDYKLSFFTAERLEADVRSRRYVTVLEIDLVDGFVDGGVVGTKEMLAFMQSLDKLRPYKIEHPSWQEGHYAFMKNESVIAQFLTPERVDVFSQILKTKNADVLVIFNDREVLIRLETSDPMQDAERIEKVVKRIITLCDKLRLTPEQKAQFSKYVPQPQA